MIGQKKLLQKLDTLTLRTLPQSNLFIGPLGSGRKTVVNIIANRFNLPVIDITKNLTQEFISETYLTPFSKIYLLDADKMFLNNKVERDENSVLKFLEEPPKSAYIFIVTQSTAQLLPTVVNRCAHWLFEPYSEEELRMFSIDEEALKIATTPGQLIALKDMPLSEMREYANRVLADIGKADYSSTLRISKKISFDTNAIEKDKYLVDIFMRIMLDCVKEYVRYHDSQSAYDAYMATNEIINKMSVAYADKDFLFDQYLIKLRRALGGTR